MLWKYLSYEHLYKTHLKTTIDSECCFKETLVDILLDSSIVANKQMELRSFDKSKTKTQIETKTREKEINVHKHLKVNILWKCDAFHKAKDINWHEISFLFTTIAATIKLPNNFRSNLHVKRECIEIIFCWNKYLCKSDDPTNRSETIIGIRNDNLTSLCFCFLSRILRSSLSSFCNSFLYLQNNFIQQPSQGKIQA